jgi:hypothetical protein
LAASAPSLQSGLVHLLRKLAPESEKILNACRAKAREAQFASERRFTSVKRLFKEYKQAVGTYCSADKNFRAMEQAYQHVCKNLSAA